MFFKLSLFDEEKALAAIIFENLIASRVATIKPNVFIITYGIIRNNIISEPLIPEV